VSVFLPTYFLTLIIFTIFGDFATFFEVFLAASLPFHMLYFFGLLKVNLLIVCVPLQAPQVAGAA